MNHFIKLFNINSVSSSLINPILGKKFRISLYTEFYQKCARSVEKFLHFLYLSHFKLNTKPYEKIIHFYCYVRLIGSK